MKPFLWQGEWLEESQFALRLSNLSAVAEEALQSGLTLESVLQCAGGLSVDLLSKGKYYTELRQVLEKDLDPSAIEATLTEVGQFLSKDELLTKISREFGCRKPHEYVRIDYKTTSFETYAPMGVLTHITPTNSVAVPALSAIEGLLALNFNIVKVSPRDSLFTHKLLAAIADFDPSAKMAKHLVVARFSSSNKEWMRAIYEVSDGVAVWGGEEAVNAVREQAGPGPHVIAWGPKISFSYVTPSYFSDEKTLDGIADDICSLDQQACSSPQIVYLDTENKEDLIGFSEKLAKAMDAKCRRYPLLPRSPAEDAEISNVVQVTRLEKHLNYTEVISSKNPGDWNILIDFRSAVRTSPLYRNIWVKPLPQKHVISNLRPMRQYLQSVGIACDKKSYGDLVQKFVRAGCLRVAPIGAMVQSYPGEPHDGTSALVRYSRKISVQAGEQFRDVSSLSEFMAADSTQIRSDAKITDKAAFETQLVEDKYKELTFKSGGSSGTPKLSYFTYDDYHFQMEQAAHGLVAAGFDPGRDRCMNLFFSGGLYGSFISFFSILENLKANQLPMAAVSDHSFVSKMIIQNNVNAILGMPSYIIQLFSEQEKELKKYAGIKKIFFGGEHFNEKQKQRFRDVFGVEIIRSAAYGSVDAGPLGYQCEHCHGSVHHVFSELQTLEIFHLEKNTPVADGEIGRLLFTSKSRSGQNLVRYEIGDLGRWVKEPCPCGRKTPRVDLLGRFGNIFRIGTTFVNYQGIANILADHLDYSGELQLKLHAESPKERIELCMTPFDTSEQTIIDTLVAHYKDLAEAVKIDNCLRLSVTFVDGSSLERTPGSGKLRTVIDLRK
ncbi:MAG: acyl-CoA reductase [Oligoflexales bacterium]